MTKKIPLTVLCLLFLLSILCFSNAMVQAEPNQAESLYTTANQCEEARQFDKAASLYGQVLAQFPEDAYGSRARLDIAKTAIISLIESGNFSQAQTELDKFTAEFKTHWYFPPAFYRIAERYEDARQLDKAKTIYQQIQQQYPKDQYGGRSQIDVPKTAIVALIESGNDTQAQISLDKFSSDFSGNAYLPTALYRIAERYEEARQLDKAKTIYQQIQQQYPKDQYGGRSQIDVLKTAIIAIIESGNDTQAQISLDKLNSDFSGNAYLPTALYRIAERFEDARWPDKAKAIYAQIAQQHPTDPYAERAKIDVIKTAVISAIESGNDSQAQIKLDQLNGDFKSDPYLPVALYRIAERYEEALKFDKAKTVYTQIVQQYPSSEFAVRSKIDIPKVEAICLIDSGKDTEIQAIISKFKSDFKGNSYLPAALYRICERFEDAKKYDTAKVIYNQIAQEFPNSSFAKRAQLNIAKINVIVNVVAGSDIATQSAVDKLATDYNSATYPMISNAIYLITEKCYAEGTKSDVNQVADDKLVALSAALLDKYVLGKICGRDNKASAYYVRGLNYNRLGDYAKAAQAFQSAYDANPKHQYADYCLFAQGYCCEKLLEQKLVSETAAAATITSKYSQLISKYPQSEYASHARSWLENNSK
jgi:TolA-binding protein